MGRVDGRSTASSHLVNGSSRPSLSSPLGQSSFPSSAETTLHSAALFSCNACRRHFASLAELTGHHDEVHSPLASPPPSHVPAFKCPRCDSVFLDTIQSLLAHYESSHGGRERLLDALSPSLIERIFCIVHHSFVSSARSAYAREHASYGDGDCTPFPKDETVWKQWFVSCFAPFLPTPLVLARAAAEEQAPPLPSDWHNSCAIPSVSTLDVTTSVASTTSTTDDVKTNNPMSSLPEDRLPPTVIASPPQPPDETSNGLAKRKKRGMDGSGMQSSRHPRRNTIAQLLTRTCVECRIIFDNRCAYTHHLLDHKKSTHPFRCSFRGCLMAYDQISKLRTHLLRKHSLEGDRMTAMLAEYGSREAEEAEEAAARQAEQTANDSTSSPTVSLTIDGVPLLFRGDIKTEVME